uniref:CUB domain-containing protein n=1 Tax=Ciona savignyi TaxID=51511 RepID=H2YCE1_CIOSA
GFNASYIQAGCGQALTATNLPQYFTSTNYPQNYPNNENCSWTIGAGVGQQVELTIITLTTESCCDYVQVFDGNNSLARLKGSASNQIYSSTSGQLRVVFFSDRSVTRAGFRASYKIESCGFNRTATVSPQYITSPDFPSNYPNNVDCEWNLLGVGGKQVELSFNGGVTETCCDYVDIFDGSNKLARLKGTFSAVSYISTTGGLRVVFHTDSSVTRSGFNASFVEAGCSQSLTATNLPQIFNSTNYPQNYPNNEN